MYLIQEMEGKVEVQSVPLNKFPNPFFQILILPNWLSLYIIVLSVFFSLMGDVHP